LEDGCFDSNREITAFAAQFGVVRPNQFIFRIGDQQSLPIRPSLLDNQIPDELKHQPEQLLYWKALASVFPGDSVRASSFALLLSSAGT
jgi:hypothetical protein